MGTIGFHIYVSRTSAFSSISKSASKYIFSAIGFPSTINNQPPLNRNQTKRDSSLTSTTSTNIPHFTMSSTYSQPQSHFSSSPAQEYDMEPSFTLSAYTREMHQHTKKQMEAASRSARRRSANAEGTNAHGRLDQAGSVSSMDSNQSS